MSSVKIENVSKTRKRLVVPVAAADVAKAEAEVVKSIVAEAQLPGFRVGKAPEAMVRAKYAKLIADELQRKVVGDSYQKALKDAKLDLCTVVDIEGDPVTTGKNGVVTVIVDVYPELKLPKYKELTAKLPKVAVDEKEVEKTIELIRGQRAQFTPVEREAQAGDYVRIAYEGKLGDKLVSEILPEKPMYGTQKSTWEEAGEHEYGIKAITVGVIGMKKGDKKTVEEKFAKDFDSKELAGKAVKYELELHEVREKKMPEMNEEFFKSIGVENLEKLKEQIKSSLESRAKEDYENSKRTQLSDALVEAVGKVELPESLLSGEEQSILDELVEENQRRGVSEEVLKKNEKQLKESAKEAAEKRVKLRLVLRKIADEEKIEIGQEDFQRWVMTEAMQRQVSPDKVVKELGDDREKASNLASALRLGKAMQIVVDTAKVEEVEAKKDEKKK